MSSSLMMQKVTSGTPTIIIEDTSETKTEELNTKLVKVLKKLLEPKFKLHNNDYLNLLLTHLTDEKGSQLTRRQLETNKQFLAIWLKGAVVQFERNKESPNPTLLVFVLNITNYLCGSEQIFVKLNSEDIFERLLTIIKRISQPNVTTSFIKLLSNFMEHKSGLQWIISTNHWEMLVDIILNSETIYVSKEGIKFVAKLLDKSHSFNSTFCKNVIQYILTPLNDTLKITTGNTTTGSKSNWLVFTLKIISEVLIMLLKVDATTNENSVILLLIEQFNLEKRLKDLMDITTDLDIKTGLYKIILLLHIYDFKLVVSGKPRNSEQKNNDVDIFNIFYEVASKISVPTMLQLLFNLFSCWDTIRATLPQSVRTDSAVVCFEDMLMMLQVIPVYTIFVKTIGFNVFDGEEEEDSFRYGFISKLVNRIYPKTVRLNYKLRDFLLDNYSFNYGIISLKYFMHSMKFYSKEIAIYTLQIFIYLIEDLNSNMKRKPENQLPFVNESDYLDLHLKAIGMLIDEFNMTWQDTVESLCIIFVVHHLLKDFIWPTKIVVAALKLAEKGISKYLTFQMALLVDNSDSILNDFSYLLRVKLYDGAWEVRDSTIELLQAFFVAAVTTEFSSYKSVLLTNDFPNSIFRMATEDGNSFVRASALKCLQKVIETQEFWEAMVRTCNFYTTILKILQFETEGIVRCEAAALVDCIYQHQNIPDDLMNNFYDNMSHAVIADLHWEVRVKALKFWKRIIDNRLTQQGMIDGSFPSVTFSKELRKIVTLSGVEVQKRLVRILYELSDIGCLSVFYEALQDECDLEVSKFATETIKDFVDLLKNHSITVECLYLHRPGTSVPTTPNSEYFPNESPHFSTESEHLSNSSLEANDIDELMMATTYQFQPVSDTVMDDILNTKDLNLLETVFNAVDEPVVENISIKPRKVLNPELFLNLVYADLENRLGEKNKWINEIDSYQSLLDDILKDYEVTDVNSMDCY